VCHHVFSVLEHSSGSALTLYTDENTTSDVVITAQLAVFELLVYLLVSELAQNRSRCLCHCVCESSGEAWALRVTVTESEVVEERERERDSTANNNSTNANNAKNNANNSNNNNGNNTRMLFNATDNNNNNNNNNNNESPTTIDGDTSVTTSQQQQLLQLQSIQSAFTSRSSLAEKIVNKYLKSQLKHVDPEFRDALRMNVYTVSLTHEVCSVTQKTNNSIMSVAEEALVSQSLTSAHKWLLVSTRTQDPQLAEFEEKLNALSVPNITMHISNVASKGVHASIAVISDQNSALVSKDLEVKHLKDSVTTLVVLTDNESFDLDPASALDVIALSSRISLSDLLEQVQVGLSLARLVFLLSINLFFCFFSFDLFYYVFFPIVLFCCFDRLFVCVGFLSYLLCFCIIHFHYYICMLFCF
jgi:hypothetical protein